MTVAVHGPLSLSDLLAHPIDDPGELALPSAPGFVFRREGESTLFAVLIDAPLNRRRLMNLLYTLAPYKAHGPDRFARVLDNWALFDRARTSEGSASLLREHEKSLGRHWQAFANHRDVFTRVLGDATGTQCVTPLLAWSRDGSGQRRWEVDLRDEALLSAIAEARQAAPDNELDTLVGLVTIPYLVPSLCAKWPAWQPLKKGGKSNYIGPASVPIMALRHQRALLGSTVIQQAEAYASQPAL